MRLELDPRSLFENALDVGDKLQIALSPRQCLGGTPTKGYTELGPYTLVIGHKRETPSTLPTSPACVALELIAGAQRGSEGSACRGICGLCNHGVWATNGPSNVAVTDSGWVRADTI